MMVSPLFLCSKDGLNGYKRTCVRENGVSKACLLDSLRGILLSERTYEGTYEEIVKLDESLDIATEIEHMIEVGKIVSEPKDKKTKSDKDNFVWMDYPKERWRIMA